MVLILSDIKCLQTLGLIGVSIVSHYDKWWALYAALHISPECFRLLQI